MNELEKFANGLKRAREAAGLRPDDVAGAANVSVSHYYGIERGEREAGFTTAGRLAAVLDASIEQLMALGSKPIGGMTADDIRRLNEINDLTLMIVRYQASKREAVGNAKNAWSKA